MPDPAIESLAPYWKTVIHNCNVCREQKKFFTPFKLEGEILGYIHPRFWEHLKTFTKVFFVDPGDLRTGTENGWITLHPTCNSTGERTRQIDLLLRLHEREKIITDWRNELCPVVARFDAHRYFSIERAALPFFGVKCYCLHLNGFVRKNGKDFLWISKRSKKKKSFAGIMDNMVAAGQPAGGNCKENLIQKAYEKANIPAHISEKAISCGHVSYEQCNGMKMKRDVIYCYDLELPPDFFPFSNDGDIENFTLVSLAEVAKMVCTPGHEGVAHELFSRRVQEGDTPWHLSQRYLGDSTQWPYLQSACDLDRDPHHLLPGRPITPHCINKAKEKARHHHHHHHKSSFHLGHSRSHH